MSHRRLKSLVGCALVALASPLMTGAVGLTNNFGERVLAAHNRERAALGIEPLTWDDRLQETAQAWADHLAVTGEFAHAPPREDGEVEGENIWGGTRGYFAAEAMVGGWIREKRYFKAGVFPDNSVTGDVHDVGHYTQVMWRHTGKVGCAIARAKREDIMVCRYSDAGNYLGEIAF